MLHERPIEENMSTLRCEKISNHAQRSSFWRSRDVRLLWNLSPPTWNKPTNQPTNLSPKSSQASKWTGCFSMSCSVCGWTSVTAMLKYSEICEWNAAVARKKEELPWGLANHHPVKKKEKKEERKKIQHIIKRKKKIQSILLLVATVADGKQL